MRQPSPRQIVMAGPITPAGPAGLSARGRPPARSPGLRPPPPPRSAPGADTPAGSAAPPAHHACGTPPHEVLGGRDKGSTILRVTGIQAVSAMIGYGFLVPRRLLRRLHWVVVFPLFAAAGAAAALAASIS